MNINRLSEEIQRIKTNVFNDTYSRERLYLELKQLELDCINCEEFKITPLES